MFIIWFWSLAVANKFDMLCFPYWYLMIFFIVLKITEHDKSAEVPKSAKSPKYLGNKNTQHTAIYAYIDKTSA